MKQMIADVWQFHRHFGHPIARVPQALPTERAKFRLMLCDEEYGELQMAMACNDLVAAGDAIADLIYVLIGTALEMGLPLSEIWDHVQRANMRKAVRDSHTNRCAMARGSYVDPPRCTCGAVQYQASGKTAKPEGWHGPEADIMREIDLKTERNQP